MNTILKEGLQTGDLNDLVLSVMSIDEFDSKIDSDAIVVALYVTDEAPAEDLSYFIETGNYELLDTEVSPSPDENGNYLIFIEFLRNKKFPMNLQNVIDELENITNNDSWSFTYYKSEGKEKEFTVDAVEQYIRLGKEKPNKMSEQEHNVYQFLKDSILEDIKLKKNKIELVHSGSSFVFEHVALGDNNLLSHLFGHSRKAISLDDNSLYECRIIQNMLGGSWEVNKIEKQFVISNPFNTQIMILEMTK